MGVKLQITNLELKIFSRPLRSFLWTCLCAGLGCVVLLACSQKPAASASAPAAAEPAVSATPAPAPEVFAADTTPLPQFDGAAAMQYVKQVVAFGPRWVDSPGHARTERFLREQLKSDRLVEDAFAATTPAGPKSMCNFIAEFPGTREGVIVVAGHYDTLYNRPDFVGANDGGSSTGLLLELAKELRGQMKNGKREGYTIRLAWLDGEEAIRQWSDDDSVYGARHLAGKWQNEGTLKRVQAFLLVDMIGDADLNVDRDDTSTPALEDLTLQAATRYGYQSHFFARRLPVGDDHAPFLKAGVPAVDLIDFDYGYGNAYWHTKDDTLDKLSPKSLEIVGSVVEEMIRMLDRK
jgi:hypothetical protein